MFKRDIKVPKVNPNPGPAHYFQDGTFDADKSKKHAHCFPRRIRTTIEDYIRPDYDGSAFYEEKGPGVKIKIRGAFISNTTNEDPVDHTVIDHTVDR